MFFDKRFPLFFLLLVSPLALADYAQGDTFFTYLSLSSNVSVTNLSIVPDPVYQNSLADFTVTLQNTGGVSANFTATISIYDSNWTFVENISFLQTAIGPTTSLSLTKAWNAGSNEAGVYTASAVAVYDQNSTNVSTNVFNQTFNISVVPPIPGGGGAGGALQVVKPTPLPARLEPIRGVIAFMKTTVLREIVAGASSFETFVVKNVGTVERHASVSLTGLPKDWASVRPRDTILLPGEERAINLALSVPESALAGDYLGKISVGDETGTSIDFMALRVKPSASFAGPIISRTVVLDRATGDATITLRLRNVGTKVIPFITVVDEVPAILAGSEQQLSFLDKRGEITSREGKLLVSWEFSDLNPRDLASFSYKIKAGALDEYSTYFTWPVKQVVVSEKIGFEQLLQVTDFRVPLMTAGKSALVSAKVFYAGTDSISILANLDLPMAFKQSPSAVSKTLGPSESANIVFEVTPPEDASGSYQVSLHLKSQEGELQKSAIAIVQKLAEEIIQPAVASDKLLLWVLIAVVVLLAGFFAYSTWAGKRGEQREAEMRFKEADHRKDYLDQVKDQLSERKKD